MKRRLIWIGVIVVTALLVEGAIYYYSRQGQSELTASEAVEILQRNDSELADYPSDTLPPRTIRTESAAGGWYVAFVQEGSGLPILGAKCFYVNADRATEFIGEFKPSRAVSDFAIRTCAELPEQEAEARPAIVDFFACSDNCPGPEADYMVKVYEGVTEEGECQALGGTLKSLIGWGTTYYCQVKQ